MTIRDETDGPVSEIRVIRFRHGQSLCDLLETTRPMTDWFNVRSRNCHESPPLEWYPRQHTSVQTRFMINRWGEDLFEPPNITRHRLSLLLDRVVQAGNGTCGDGAACRVRGSRESPDGVIRCGVRNGGGRYECYVSGVSLQQQHKSQSCQSTLLGTTQSSSSARLWVLSRAMRA